MSSPRRGLVAGLCLLLGAGCARQTAQDPALPPPPGAWTATSTDATDPTSWAATLADPGLDALIREALAANHDLAAAAARVRAAEAEARIAGAERQPKLDLNASATRTRLSPSGTEVNQFNVGLSASWEVDLWGRWSRRAQAAAVSLAAVEADRDAAERSLAAQVAKAWYAGRSARAEVVLAETLAETQAASVQVAERRFADGLIEAETVRELRSALASAQNRATSARIALDAQTRRLEILLGRYPGARLATPADLPEVSAPPPAGIPADCIARRPDVRAAEARFQAGRLRADAAQADLYPRIALTASGGRSSADLGDLLDADFSVWSLGGNLLQPLFQGGRLRATRDRADADADAAGQAFASTVLRALGEVETALATGVLLEERDRLQASILAESRALAVRAARRHAAGIGDALGVLAARRGEQEAALTALALRQLRIENRIDLLLALGGDLFAAKGP